MSYDLTYLAFGAGVQSTALLICSNLGLHGVPRCDYAIFADTGDEPQWVYDQLEAMREWSKIPVLVVKEGRLSRDFIDRQRGLRKRCANIPLWTTGKTGKPTPLKRHCTRDYKITPMQRKVRELLGYKKGQWVKKEVLNLVGISTDEISRAKPAREKWITTTHPLIDAGIDRTKARQIVMENGFPQPLRSACVFCPFRSNEEWLELKEYYPGEFAMAVCFDQDIRDLSASGLENPAYVHKTLKPLNEVDFTEKQLSFLDDWTNECEGMCGV